MTWRVVGVAVCVASMLSLTRSADAATIDWKGHTWKVTNGGMAGVCQGNAANVTVDANSYLHMKISNSGGTWTAAEIFSTDKIGFGTYQWQIEGPTDKLDKNVVVGLFPYGPEAGLGVSGNNEIDIEFARWGNDAWPNGNYTVWPPTGSTTGSHSFELSLGGGTSVTTRFAWNSSKIDFVTLKGFVAIDGSSGLVDSWTFAPANPTTRITQEAMPLGMNLWCFDNPPSDGQDVEIIVRDFQFVPSGVPFDGGAGGTGGGEDGPGGSDGSTGAGGSDGRDGGDVAASAGGAEGTGGVAGTGGVERRDAAGSGGVAAGGAAGTGGVVKGDAAGSGGIATGGVAVSPGSATGGTSGTGGAMGTGGADSGGAKADAAVGGGGAGGAGSSGAGDASGAATKGSAGCSCGVASSRSMLGSQFMLLVVALLLARRHRGRRRV